MSVPRPIIYASLVVGLLAPGVTAFAVSDKATPEVNVYSYRQPFLVDPLFEKFTAETGIAVKVIFAKKLKISFEFLTTDKF